jgi:predicted GNAT family acetyltransferase
MVEPSPFPPIPRARLESVAIVNQMVSTRSPATGDGFSYLTLGPAEAAEMPELATLTAPGPFFAGAHLMGRFIGVREGDRLVAMAGQRMRVPGFTEVSAVCTHPDHRGRGHAGKLVRVLIDAIIASGDSAFLRLSGKSGGDRLVRSTRLPVSGGADLHRLTRA